MNRERPGKENPNSGLPSLSRLVNCNLIGESTHTNGGFTLPVTALAEISTCIKQINGAPPQIKGCHYMVNL